MKTAADQNVTVRMPESWLWIVRIGGAALGFGAGFGVAPLVGWMLDLVGGAPGPLRLAAQLPTVWAVPVLTVVGAVGGAWVAAVWQKENPILAVNGEHVVVHHEGSGVHIGRSQVGSVFTDGRDLVMLDHAGGELTRSKADDLSTKRLSEAFETFGYPWLGTADPRESEFVTWVDRSPDLDEQAHVLFRARNRAKADKRIGAAEEALDGLRALGIAVRDRGKEQQYRKAG